MDALRPGSHPCYVGDPVWETLFLSYAGGAGCHKLLHLSAPRVGQYYLPL